MGVKCSPTRLLWFVVSFCEPSDVAVMLQGFSILGLVIWVVLFGIWMLIQFSSFLACQGCLLSMLSMNMLDFIVLLSYQFFIPVP